MAIKVTVPTNSGDYLSYGNATTPVAASVGGYEDSTGNGHLEWYTTSSGTVTERMRIDSAGNVGIGTNAPSYPLHVQAGASAASYIGSAGNANTLTSNGMVIGQDSTGLTRWYQFGANPVTVWTNNVERMRIDGSGNVLINTTSQLSSGKACLAYAGNANQGLVFNDTSSNATAQPLRFLSGGTLVGYVQTSTSATTYVTSSDYRLKENIVPMVGALEKVALLKPVTYKWKIDGSDGQGFIAHELQEVIPDCVVGTKDALDKDGNPEYQGIDTSFLVATLTAAIQELNAKVTALEAQLGAK